LSNTNMVLNWPALVGRRFNLETSTNLLSWTVTASNLLATTPTYSFITNANDSARFFRVQRTP